MSQSKERKKALQRYFTEPLETWMYRLLNKMPKDSQVDDWLDEDIENLKTKAIEKVNLQSSDLENEVLSIVGFRLGDLGGAKLAHKVGRDGELRVTPVVISIIMTTQHKLAIYQCLFDRLQHKVLNQMTYNCFYEKIASYGTQTISIKVDPKQLNRRQLERLGNYKEKLDKDGKLDINNVELFELRLAGDTFRIDLPDPALVPGLDEQHVVKGEAERTIALLSRIIDDKQNSMK